MGKFYAFLLGVAAGFGLYHMSISYHVVRASDGLHLVSKTTPTLSDTYVDIRGFTAADAAEHLALGMAIAASDNAKLQQEFAGNVVQGVLDQVLQPPPSQ